MNSKNRPRVVLTRRWPAAVEAVLGESYEVVLNDSDTPFSTEELQDALGQADVLCPTVTDSLDASTLSHSDIKVRLIANFGVDWESRKRCRGAHGISTTGRINE